MTRRTLARRLSRDLLYEGPHYINGSTVYQTLDGDWGAYVGLHRPPNDAQWFEHVGWDVVVERNTTGKVETTLRGLELKYTGKAKRIDRKTLS